MKKASIIRISGALLMVSPFLAIYIYAAAEKGVWKASLMFLVIIVLISIINVGQIMTTYK